MIEARARCAIALRSVGGCEAPTLANALRALPGIIEVQVNPALEWAYVEYDAARLTTDAIIDQIVRAGFQPERIRHLPTDAPAKGVSR